MSFVPRVLIVDDAETAQETFARTLPRERYVCEMASTAARADQAMRRTTFDIVVAVVHLDGFALLDRLKRDRPTLPVILVSAQAGIQVLSLRAARLRRSARNDGHRRYFFSAAFRSRP